MSYATAGLLVVSVVACGTPQPPEFAPIDFDYPAFVGDSVSVDDQTWFLFGPQVDDQRPRTICRLRARELVCAKVPASEHGARLVEPAHGATALIALPFGENDTVYVEPFTWKTVRRVEAVSFRQHGVVLRDGTLWIEQRDNILVVPPARAPRRWFDESVSWTFVSPMGVLWVEYRGPDPATRKSVVLHAPIEGDRLGASLERADLEPWILGYGSGICRAGSIVGLVELRSKDLVRFDLETDVVSRIHVGEGMYMHCGPGVVAATPLSWHEWSQPSVSWCDRKGCRVHAVRLPMEHPSGAFTVIDNNVFAVGVTLDNTLVTWKVGEPPRLVELSRRQDYYFHRAVALPDGALVLSIHGPLLVFDVDGNIRPVNLTWFPFAH